MVGKSRKRVTGQSGGRGRRGPTREYKAFDNSDGQGVGPAGRFTIPNGCVLGRGSRKRRLHGRAFLNDLPAQLYES
jgi:hypothetical protein